MRRSVGGYGDGKRVERVEGEGESRRAEERRGGEKKRQVIVKKKRPYKKCSMENPSGIV